MNLQSVIFPGATTPTTVIPAKAGIQLARGSLVAKRDASLRWHDGFRVGASL
jgi:hypothetical protein